MPAPAVIESETLTLGTVTFLMMERPGFADDWFQITAVGAGDKVHRGDRQLAMHGLNTWNILLAKNLISSFW